jgi:hypothetical protein
VAAVVILTFIVCGEEDPQELFAVTEIVPPVEPDVAFIELLVELPDHPEGSVHEYEMAPDTGETE